MKRSHCTVCGRFNPGVVLPPLSQLEKLRMDKRQKERTQRKEDVMTWKETNALSTSVEYLKTSLHTAPVVDEVHKPCT
ncbi:hypothetical protein IRJ41_003510 [Triplophysa rosa]|uniref:Uncharacterized protein n=1 Tax=Triplophysa rosa TaxID=992332 RepID=A0A9W7T3K1_TRIRA|nr:hypothetical protein IRJ41_003510 [Triplophysa rosa]